MSLEPVKSVKKRVAVIGAGFSGLATAYFLNKRGWQVEVFEASDRAGGLIESRITKNGLVESAANGILNSALLESVASDIGCSFLETKKDSRARFIVRGGRARRWPLSLPETFSLLSAVVRYFVARSWMAPRAFESLRAWGARTLGRGVSRYTIETAVQGIYAMRADDQSASLTLRHFFARRKLPTDSPAPVPKRRGTVAPRGGLGELIGKLQSALIERGVTFHFHSRVAGLPPGFDATVIATSVTACGELLRALGDHRARAVEQVRTEALVSVTAFWPQPAAGAEPLRGFGCLFPRDEGHAALGVLFNTSIFENRASDGSLSETWIFADTQATDDELLGLIQEERRKLGQTEHRPLEVHVTRWPQALPRYDRELEAQLPAILERPQGSNNLYLVGNYLGEIGLKSLLARAQLVARQIDKECT